MDRSSGWRQRLARALEPIPIGAGPRGPRLVRSGEGEPAWEALLLEDLLALSRTGRVERPHEDVAFEEVVREAQALTAGRLATRGV